MVENVLAWGCLLMWLLSGDAQFLIATGTFAIATQIYHIRKER